jgi:CRP-like cAMP-binding protein
LPKDGPVKAWKFTELDDQIRWAQVAERLGCSRLEYGSALLSAHSPFEINPLIRKLDSIFTLSDEERGAVASLPMQAVNLRTDQDIVSERDRPSRCCAMLDGFTCSYKLTAEGKRQILAFHVAGDIPDLQSLHLPVLDNSIGTITPCRVGFIKHEPLRQLCERYPRIAGALRRATLIEAAVLRERMTSIGRRNAFSRIAHLLCEIVVRMRAADLGRGRSCDFPVTQTEIGDALGITMVHVNRTLKEIREAGLATLNGGVLKVLDWDALKEAGAFDPTYLHLDADEAAACAPHQEPSPAVAR